MIFSAKRDRAHGALDGVGVDLDPAVVDELAEACPAGESVADRGREWAFAGDAAELGFEPGLEPIEDRPARRTPRPAAIARPADHTDFELGRHHVELLGDRQRGR